jgi:cytochrome c oxidase assembly factor CtaG
VSDPVAEARPEKIPAWVRHTLFALGLLLVVLALVPPVSTQAHRYVYAEAIQFSLLAVAAPCLLVLGAPWAWLRLSVGRPAPELPPPAEAKAADRLAEGRRRHRHFVRSLPWLVAYMVAVVGWRTVSAVDGLRSHPWLLAVEALTLLATGGCLWAELVDSPPLRARQAPPARIALAALAMWTIWISAYLVGLAHGSVYRTYPHVAGAGLSAAADQEVATFVLWFVPAVAFVPLIFANLVSWLSTDEDPDREMDRVLREEHRRSLGR